MAALILDRPLIGILKVSFNSYLFWVVWWAQMAAFSLVKSFSFKRINGEWVGAVRQMLIVWFLLHISHCKELVQPNNLVSGALNCIAHLTSHTPL